jgi:hypothetical protein
MSVSIHFTIGTESNGHLPFLDIDMYRRPDSSFGHTVYRKPTHTNLYQNAESHHHPTNKHSVLSTFIHWNRAICEQESLLGELEFVIVYSYWMATTVTGRSVMLLIYFARRTHLERNWHWWPSYFFFGTTFNCISRALMRHNIETVGRPHRKVTSFLWPIKDDLGVKITGVYSIPCECGKVYTGLTGHSIETRIKEHHWHIRLCHLEKSAVAKHSINLGHCI